MSAYDGQHRVNLEYYKIQNKILLYEPTWIIPKNKITVQAIPSLILQHKSFRVVVLKISFFPRFGSLNKIKMKKPKHFSTYYVMSLH